MHKSRCKFVAYIGYDDRIVKRKFDFFYDKRLFIFIADTKYRQYDAGPPCSFPT